MSIWVVYAEQTGSLAGMASYDRIQDLFSRARLPQLSGGGSWASRVRVTRTGGIRSAGQGQTTAAALYSLPDDYSANAKELALQNLRASMNGMLTEDANSGHNAWQTLTIVPYNPVLNGPMSFWECASAENCAANTMTKNQSPAGEVTTYENPTGPTIAGVNSIKPFNYTPVFAISGIIFAAIGIPILYNAAKEFMKSEEPVVEPTPTKVKANRNVKWL